MISDYDLSGAWILHWGDSPTSTTFPHQQPLQFAKAGDPIIDRYDPTTKEADSCRRHFISKVTIGGVLVVTQAQVFTGVRYLDTAVGSPKFPCAAVAFYQGPAQAGKTAYYSSWSGSVGVDRSDHLHPKYNNSITGYFAGIEGDQGKFVMNRA